MDIAPLVRLEELRSMMVALGDWKGEAERPRDLFAAWPLK